MPMMHRRLQLPVTVTIVVTDAVASFSSNQCIYTVMLYWNQSAHLVIFSIV